MTNGFVVVTSAWARLVADAWNRLPMSYLAEKRKKRRDSWPSQKTGEGRIVHVEFRKTWLLDTKPGVISYWHSGAFHDGKMSDSRQFGLGKLGERNSRKRWM